MAVCRPVKRSKSELDVARKSTYNPQDIAGCINNVGPAIALSMHKFVRELVECQILCSLLL
jgi:hypothetical protein